MVGAYIVTFRSQRRWSRSLSSLIGVGVASVGFVGAVIVSVGLVGVFIASIGLVAVLSVGLAGVGITIEIPMVAIKIFVVPTEISLDLAVWIKILLIWLILIAAALLRCPVAAAGNAAM